MYSEHRHGLVKIITMRAPKYLFIVFMLFGI